MSVIVWAGVAALAVAVAVVLADAIRRHRRNGARHD